MNTDNAETPIVFGAAQAVADQEASPHGAVATAGVPAEHEDGATEEAGDSFPVATNPQFMIDVDSLALVNNDPTNRSGPPSVATTELASAVGSVVGPPRDAFLKSLTFFKPKKDDDNMSWSIQLSDPISRSDRRNKKKKMYVLSVEGLFALSKIHEGDYLKSINQKRIGPSMNAERALERMHSCLENENVLFVSTQNKEEGDDILVQATIIKPRPEMTYKKMGLVVWHWGYLCIKEIDEESIFKHTVLKETDNIVSINDISCDGMKPEQFAEVMSTLPFEITITVLRRKQRLTGRFG